MSPILEARQRLEVAQSDVCTVVGKSAYWMNRAEAGQQPVTPEEEAVILRAITKLAAFDRAVIRQRQEFLAGLKLPTAHAQ
jgi:hypothetical protein